MSPFKEEIYYYDDIINLYAEIESKRLKEKEKEEMIKQTLIVLIKKYNELKKIKDKHYKQKADELMRNMLILANSLLGEKDETNKYVFFRDLQPSQKELIKKKMMTLI